MGRKTSGWSWILASLAASFVLAGPVRAAADDRQAVGEAVAQFYRALNLLFTGDVAPMTEVWSHADDVTYLGPDGGFEVGWSQVLGNWQKQAAMKLGGVVKPEGMHTAVGPDLAVINNYEKGENPNVGGQRQVVSIRATNVFRKEQGKWKMIGHHVDPLLLMAK